MKIEILTHIKNIVHDRDEVIEESDRGARYYKDENGKCWYPQRNALRDDKPIIVVDKDTDRIMMYWLGDPQRLGLPLPTPLKRIDVIQAEKFPFDSEFDVFNNEYYFKDGVVTKVEPKIVQRTKEDIMTDLIKLQNELEQMK